MGIKVSIITVCYNTVGTIERTIQSVISQSYKDIEYIIIDGGSSDGTTEIINKYKERISYSVSEPDKGIYDAMNKGVIHATGEWLNFMNAGDIYTSSNIIESIIGKIPPRPSENPVCIIRGNILRIYKNFTVKSSGVTSQNPGLMDMFNNTFHHQACFIHRSLFQEYGLYSTEYKLTADWKFFFDCVVLYHVHSKYVDIDVARFNMDGASSRNVQDCLSEQKLYLTSLFGYELYEIFNELSVYRKFKLFRCFSKLYLKFRGSLSPHNFSRILTAKRFIRSKLGLVVN